MMLATSPLPQPMVLVLTSRVYESESIPPYNMVSFVQKSSRWHNEVMGSPLSTPTRPMISGEIFPFDQKWTPEIVFQNLVWSGGSNMPVAWDMAVWSWWRCKDGVGKERVKKPLSKNYTKHCLTADQVAVIWHVATYLICNGKCELDFTRSPCDKALG